MSRATTNIVIGLRETGKPIISDIYKEL